MPRQARKISESGIYHVILRGINKQAVFEGEEEKAYFLSLLREYKPICGYELLAYCLMDNHAHLLIKVGHDFLDSIFRRIAGKYSYWYNNSHQRVGHLFQDRYKSEPVDDDNYLLAAVRYIHQNPLMAGIVSALGDYPYSSYNDYLEGKDSQLTDTGFVLGIMNKTQFVQFHKETGKGEFLEVTERKYRPTDEQAIRCILEVSQCKHASDIQSLDAEHKGEIIQKLKTQGLSIRQLSRLTGISKSIVERS